MHLLEPTALRSGTPRHRPRQVDERLTGTPATACQAPASAKCGLVDLQAVRTTATTQDHGGQVGGRVRTLPIRMQPDEPSKVQRWDRLRAPFLSNRLPHYADCMPMNGALAAETGPQHPKL